MFIGFAASNAIDIEETEEVPDNKNLKMDGSTDFPLVHTLNGLTDRSEVSNISAHANHPLDLHIPQGDLHLIDEFQVDQVLFCVWKICRARNRKRNFTTYKCVVCSRSEHGGKHGQ